MSDLKGSGRYKIIQTVKMGDAGETYICEDLNDTARGRFTLLSIRDHLVMHRFVDICTKSGQPKENM